MTESGCPCSLQCRRVLWIIITIIIISFVILISTVAFLLLGFFGIFVFLLIIWLPLVIYQHRGDCLSDGPLLGQEGHPECGRVQRNQTS